MFNAARLPSEIDMARDGLDFHDDAYSYVLSRDSDKLKFSVKDKANSIFGTVDWVFGAPGHSQTYLIKQNGIFLESRLSYFASLAKLDITPGHALSAPPAIEQALGTRIDPETIRRCFGCHSTASTAAGRFDPGHAVLGVTCEACHGPGLQHVTSMATAQSEQAQSMILNPSRFSPVDSVDFCGACHRTPVDVGLMPGNLGLTSIRFQPYRLEKSRCWGTAGDRRITCVACHDPHKPLEHDRNFYDRKCLSCHAVNSVSQTSPKPAPPCKIAHQGCPSCHMPKVSISWAHETFTDHLIRIVRKDQFPPKKHRAAPGKLSLD